MNRVKQPTPCRARCTFHMNRNVHLSCRYCERSHGEGK